MPSSWPSHRNTGPSSEERTESQCCCQPYPEHLLPDEKLPPHNARGGDGWRQSRTESCCQVGTGAWHKAVSELGHHTFPSTHARKLVQDKTSTLATGGAMTWRLRGRKALVFGMSMILEIHLAQCLAYEKSSVNVGETVLRLSGGTCA